MKKLATALVSAAAIMTMSTTAFAAENPAEVFDRVMEKNNTIQSVEIQSRRPFGHTCKGCHSGRSDES